MDNDYTQITWPEVRAGDVLLHENGDRLTVENVAGHNISTVTGYRSVIIWGDYGFTPYRKQPELPTEPGAYLDKDGDYWLHRGDDKEPWVNSDGDSFSPEEMGFSAPFTRLVPMPTRETVREALSEVRFNLTTEQWNTWQFQEEATEAAADAVMALLAGKEAASE